VTVSPMFKNGTLVSGWLRDMGCSPNVVADSQSNWLYEIAFPVGTPVQIRINVGNPIAMPRAVVFGARMVPAAHHVAAWEALDDDVKREFWLELRATLNREFVEFAIEGKPLTECPPGFQVFATRFDDALTLDSLYRTISSVTKACLDGGALFDEHLGTAGPAAGGEFAFKKLGVQ
jgi:hypothetical protein